MGLLEIDNLFVKFSANTGDVSVLSGMDLDIEKGDTICLVGESGCGKTIVALSIMRLLAENAVISGEIRFNGRDLLALTDKEMRSFRGRAISMIFEQPASCLNPVFSVGDQISEAVKVGEMTDSQKAKETAMQLMKLTGIPSPKKRYHQYPHEFSGGMLQRVMISMAMASRPELLIADEPTTSLDVTVQAQIIELIRDLVSRFGTTLLLITHDLDVAAELCERVAVMYAGEIVEIGNLTDVFSDPCHPYTRSLLSAISDEGLKPIMGSVPELTDIPKGCRFYPRCSLRTDLCRSCKPDLIRGVRCHLWQES